ncbi:DUF2332 domain-containing protein [Nocardia sp. NBC_01327]|uniref:DUF2332 domain-containing protein n=1 Tax=Nocardia sp. NBC_01327 TaxID=2903593 RepID=UPI002E14A9A7|nr:DUF2332 domain-containing protein [Nocardia sp. NBC_01327]
METSQRYRRFAELEVRGFSPCYEEWSGGIAGSPRILGLIDQLPEPRRQPNLVFGAARYVGAVESGFAEFADFLITHWAEVYEVAMTHRTQTNEAGRTATLLPVLNLYPAQPVALIEFGASAGLCLYPDRYSYRYDDRPILDPADGRSDVVLSCTTSGRPPIPEVLPQVAYRAGVDLNPLDLADAENLRWLECLIWPEQRDRLVRLRSAAAIVRRDPPELVAGDLVDAIADLVHAVPQDIPVIVFGSAVLTYLPPERRAAFREVMRALPCRWITNEGTAVLDFGSAALPAAPAGIRMITALDGDPVAYAAPHGQTLDWFGSAG